jgi:hypothetical protein
MKEKNLKPKNNALNNRRSGWKTVNKEEREYKNRGKQKV